MLERIDFATMGQKVEKKNFTTTKKILFVMKKGRFLMLLFSNCILLTLTMNLATF